MKKTKVLPRKLVLNTETIRKLDQDQLLAVNGGLPRTAWSAVTHVSCPE